MEKKLNILVAYPYMEPNVISFIKDHESEIRFLLDSGAFTAWKAGKPIALDDYCKFIESLPFKPWRYFSLDVIGDPKKTFENYQTMLSRGFTPVPIFTRGEDVSMIDEYYKTSDVVGIGGLVGTQGNTGFVKGIMKVVGGRRVHWLGFVRHNFVNYYKPYMCDASSWSHASRNGDLKVYMGKGIIKSYRRINFITRPDNNILKIFQSFDVSIQELKSDLNWKSHKWLNTMAARMWVRRSIESEINLNTYLFLAAASKSDLNMIYDGFKKEISK